MSPMPPLPPSDKSSSSSSPPPQALRRHVQGQGQEKGQGQGKGHGYRATHAIGTLTARITARLGRRQPAKKILSTLQNNWTRIAPQDFLKHAKPTHVSQAPGNTTLTLTVQQAFAPIALHRTTQLLNNINAFLGSDTIQSVKLKQTNSPM